MPAANLLDANERRLCERAVGHLRRLDDSEQSLPSLSARRRVFRELFAEIVILYAKGVSAERIAGALHAAGLPICARTVQRSLMEAKSRLRSQPQRRSS
jgi:hypothetical protein